MSLSARWTGDTHRALAASGSVVQRLALALGPVRSVIRVIDDHVPPMTVDWAQAGKDDQGRSMSISFTDFENGRIAVNPLPVMELGKTDPGRAIDVSTGFGMHEAAHGKHSRDRFKDLTKNGKPAFRPMRVATYLWGLVEDVRIEGETESDWPGFGSYFDAVLDWVWGFMRKRHDIPETYGETVADKIKVVFLACRYPSRVPLGRYDDEVAWWQAWQGDYLSGRADTKATIQSGLDHLGEDPATQSEMDEMAAAEDREQAAGERVRAMISRLVREGITGAYEVCITNAGDMRPLTGVEADQVDELVREGFMVISPQRFDIGAECPMMAITKPQETVESREAYIGRPDASVEALRAALVFRSALPQYDIKLQRSGELDDAELHRWAMNDYRLFTERVIEGKPDTFVGLLVDLSGSMAYGGKLPTAQRLAQVMLWALHDQDGIDLRVWGHSGDAGENGSHVYRLWEPGDRLERLGLIDTLTHGNNYDGYAIAWCIEQMREQPQPQKVLIVLSDGLPAGHGYGREPAARHVRHVTDAARRQGIKVLQIAIDKNLHMRDQVRMFGVENVIPFKSEAMLPRQLTKVLARWA